MWNTFESVREILENQYRHPNFDPDSGPDYQQLRAGAEAYWAARGSDPLILVRAGLLDYVLRNSRIGVDPADWFADHVEGRDLLLPFIDRRKLAAENSLPPAMRQTIHDYSSCGAFTAALDLSHTSPDWTAVLELGPAGLRDRALAAPAAARDPAAAHFYTAAAQAFEAMRILILRFAALAEKRRAPHQATALRALAERPPETLQEALQLALIYDTCQEIEGEPVRSQGQFDRLFIRFYRHDLDSGLLTREQAKELLKFFWTKFYAQMHPNGKNFGFGGLTASGADACNELTELGLEIHQELNRINPKLSFRLHRGTPPRFLRQAAECVRSGRTALVFHNDDLAFELFRRRGKAAADLHNYVLIGCYEPAIMGREMCCSMSAWGNLAKPLEAAFNSGRTFDGVRLGPECPMPASYREFEAEYLRQLDHVLCATMQAVREFELRWPDTNPSPLLSGTMADCLRSGRDVSAAGTRYNSSGVMCASFGSAVDALAAVRHLVETRKLCTVSELADILKNNWAGADNLRLEARNRAPKFGCADARADRIARRLFRAVTRRINSTPNARGGTFQTGLWSINHNLMFGRKTAATPDGRFAGEPLSLNAGGSIGMERQGVVALMRSVAGLDLAECPDGTALDVLLHPSAVSDFGGVDVITGLIRAFFASGGLAVQFNLLDAEDLKKARDNPELYSDLQVRVCGWNSRFVNLSADEQNAFIARAELQT